MSVIWRKTWEVCSAGSARAASDDRSPAPPTTRATDAAHPGRRPGRRPGLPVWLAVVLLAGLLPLLAASTACAAPEPATGDGEAADADPATVEEHEDDGAEPLVGVVRREEIEAHEPDWVAAQVEAEVDPGAARALLEVEPGADVTVYLGTWCGDSKRELARLWRAFDTVGIDPSGAGMGEQPPFDLEYVAVDRDKQAPGGLVEGVDLRFVPTFVVRRSGEEVGRMVEVSPNGIEHDLLALLTGQATGVVSARDDLGDGEPEGTGEDGGP